MGNNLESNRPKASKGHTWRYVLKPIWEKRRYFEGSGTGSATVIIPSNPTNLNNPGEIRINIETQDLFTHPSESYLIFEGRQTKDDGTAYANADNVALTNNGIMHLFSNFKYQLSSQEIESLSHPGQVTTMLGLLKYPNDFSKSQG